MLVRGRVVKGIVHVNKGEGGVVNWREGGVRVSLILNE